MFKQFVVFIISILLVNCGGSYYNFSDKTTQKNINLEANKIKIKSFELKLYEARGSGRISADNAKSQFLNTKEMENLMLKTINGLLQKNGYLSSNSDAYTYSFKVSASRSFHFLSNKYIGLNIESLKIDVHKDGKLIASKNLMGTKPSLIISAHSPIIACETRGMFGNLKKIGQSLGGGSAKADAEIEDVKSCAQALYNSILALES